MLSRVVFSAGLAVRVVYVLTVLNKAAGYRRNALVSRSGSEQDLAEKASGAEAIVVLSQAAVFFGEAAVVLEHHASLAPHAYIGGSVALHHTV